MAVVVVCAGTVTESGGVPSCSEAWQVVQYTQAVPFDPSQLEPATLGVMFSAGFFVLVPVWAACLGLKKLLRAIRSF